MSKKNIVLDATLLTSLMSCARYVDLRFNNQFVSNKGKSNSLETGSIVHKVLELFYQSKINGLRRELCIANGMAAGLLYIKGCQHCTDFNPTDEEPKPKCGHIPNDYPGVHNTPEQNDTKLIGWQWALDTCEQYFEHYKNEHWAPLFVETVKGKIFYEDDNIRVFFKSKFDLAVDTNQQILSVDHKTMKQRRDSISLNNQFMGQCINMESRNMIINKIGFQTSLKPMDKFQRVMMSYSADRLLEWQNEILPYWAYQYLSFAESGIWPPNFTNCETKYGFCEMKEVCESNTNMREEVIKVNFIRGPEWNPTNLDGNDD